MNPETLARRVSDATLAFLEVLTLYLGDRLGLYRTLAREGSATAADLAARAGIHPRYAQEWLEQQAASGLLEVDDAAVEAGSRRYRLPPEHAEVLVEGDSLLCMAARPMSLVAAARKLPRLIEAFRTGGGVGDGDHEVREAQASLGRPAFLRLLGTAWLPAIPDLHARLRSGPPARVADLGCGGGWSSIALALAYPGLRVDGFDLDAPSIALARRNAEQAAVADRVAFAVRDAADPDLEGRYDLVMAFEALHDMPRPVDALRSMRRLAREAGFVLVVDEKVGEAFEAPADELTRLNYAWSVLSCLPAGMAGETPAGTGAVMRPATLESYAQQAGFRRTEVLPVEHDTWRFYRLRND